MRTMTDLKLSICYGNMAACFTTVCRPMLSVDDVNTAGVTFDTHMNSIRATTTSVSVIRSTLYPMMIVYNEWKRAKSSIISPTGSGNPFM